MSDYVFHLLPNAHLDPVWLWNRQEGLNEGINTTRTMLDFMDEFPDFTFIRGEAAIYDHIERHDPETFARLSRRIAEGRWDVVGGNWIQPDNNLPSTFTALKQLEIGKGYFKEKFGLDIKAGWIADAFGHSRGLPEIYAAHGMRYFAFCRPSQSLLPLDNTAFYWRGQGGSELLCYRSPTASYGSDRQGDFIPAAVLDRLLQQAPQYRLRNLALFYGLGNHGGGTTRHHLDGILTWRERHPEVKLKFSTLHGFFAALEQELKENGRQHIPTFDGELNGCLRGCYASVMHLKKTFRTAEAITARSSRIQAVLEENHAPETMRQEWQDLCFNAFHDILPGTSIESACEEQLQQIDSVTHYSRDKEFTSLTRFAARINTTVKPAEDNLPNAVPFLFFNPWPQEFRGQVELEAGLDFRPLWNYLGPRDQAPVELLDANGTPLPFQVIETEHHCLRDIPPWRYRTVFELTLPPMGWQVISMGYRKEPLTAASPVENQAHSPAAGMIANGNYRVEAKNGDKYLRIFRNGHPLCGLPGLSFATFEDPFGSLGDMTEAAANQHLTVLVAQWHISRWKLLESGPERAALWVEFTGQSSRLSLTVQLSRNTNAVMIRARLWWTERACRLKMLMAQGDEVVYEVPGGTITRGETVSVPGGRWTRVRLPDGTGYGLVSNAFYSFENEAGYFAATLCRGVRYCTDITSNAAEYPELAAADDGVLKFDFLLTSTEAELERLAENLEQPPTVIMCASHPGALPKMGMQLDISNPVVKLCDLQRCHGQLFVWVQNRSDTPQSFRLRTATTEQLIHDLPPWRIMVYQI